jgi:hypothetical protein
VFLADQRLVRPAVLTRREFALLTGVTALAVILPDGSTGAAGAAAGWALRFERVHDLLLVRVGDEQGPLISWGDRGLGGTYTWSWQDPVGDTRDISGFPGVGDGAELRLWAKILSAGATGDQGADFAVIYDGAERQRRAFDNYEDLVVRRLP